MNVRRLKIIRRVREAGSTAHSRINKEWSDDENLHYMVLLDHFTDVFNSENKEM